MTVSLYSEYLEYIEENDKLFSLYEDVKDLVKKVPSKLKSVFSLITELAKSSAGKVQDWIKVFKDSKVFKFFEEFGFSLKKIYEFIHKNLNLIDIFFNELSAYIAKTGVVKWTASKLNELDKYLDRNPLIKKAGGIFVFVLLIWVNLNMIYIGDPIYDFDISVAVAAFWGEFTLVDLFASESGIKLLTMLIAGMIVPTFNWGMGVKFIGLFSSWIIKTYKMKTTYSLIARNFSIKSRIILYSHYY